MEQTVECSVDLFGEVLPSMAEIKTFCDLVNSSEKNRISFAEEVESHLSASDSKSCLATGIGLYILSRNKQAETKLNKASDCQEKYFYLAFTLRRARKFEEAIKNLDKALKYDADTLTVALEKAGTYRIAGNYEAASEELGNCGNYANVSAEYHYQLGHLQEEQGEYNQAMENYKQALELFGNHQEALFRLAYRCDLSGNEEAAIDYYKQIVMVNPVYVNALMNLAVLYEDKEEYDKAALYIGKVLEHHPNHQRANLFMQDIESSKTMYYDEEIEERLTRKVQILETPISDFELSVRSRNCLRKMNIFTLGDLLDISETELLSYKNFGETSLKEIKAILEPRALHLGMSLEETGNSSGGFNENNSENVEVDEGIFSKPLSDLPLSVRARKCLDKLELDTIGELTQKTDAELLGCKNFGVTSLNEIKKALSNFGLSLKNLD